MGDALHRTPDKKTAERKMMELRGTILVGVETWMRDVVIGFRSMVVVQSVSHSRDARSSYMSLRRAEAPEPLMVTL